MNENKLRTAAYVRVSTKLEEQEGSYDIQVSYFTDKINANPGMTLVGIYGDLGKSGLKTKGRDGLARLMADCEAGKIDLILTKSISRFARNMADCAEMIRKLRELGVGIIFEKENINSKDAKCDLILNIFAALAQEESNSISQNSIRAHEQHAKLLQISRMLHNEKYVGDVVLQKHYVESHLTHKEVRNNGELPLFHIKNAHPAIIDRHLFVQTQQILEMRQVKTGNSSYPYGTMLKCPHCGKTLVHGSLYDVRFGGELLHNGGWGCYGEDGCGEYLLVQNVLDEVLIHACEKKYGERMEKVDFYWVDDTMEEIVLGDYTVEIHWRDGEVTTEAMPLTHPEFYPLASAMRYNAFLNKVRSGQRKVKSKFLMGL